MCTLSTWIIRPGSQYVAKPCSVSRHVLSALIATYWNVKIDSDHILGVLLIELNLSRGK